jgi:hypothetical protein
LIELVEAGEIYSKHKLQTSLEVQISIKRSDDRRTKWFLGPGTLHLYGFLVFGENTEFTKNIADGEYICIELSNGEELNLQVKRVYSDNFLVIHRAFVKGLVYNGNYMIGNNLNENQRRFEHEESLKSPQRRIGRREMRKRQKNS